MMYEPENLISLSIIHEKFSSTQRVLVKMVHCDKHFLLQEADPGSGSGHEIFSQGIRAMVKTVLSNS